VAGGAIPARAACGGRGGRIKEAPSCNGDRAAFLPALLKRFDAGMDDRFNTIAGWALGAGIVLLGGVIVTGEMFKAERPETLG